MRIWSYDLEVFKHDWTMVAKEYGKDNFIEIHNDVRGLSQFLKSEPLLIGFNNKFYDNHILRVILAKYDNPTIKEISDYIVQTDEPAWTHHLVKRSPYLKIKSTDLKDDMQIGFSLKAIAGHFGWSILESSIPFDIDRPLTKEELTEVLKYNKNDVIITEKLAMKRATYLNTKKKLGSRVGLSIDESLRLTNAGLTAKYLRAEKQVFTDAREIVYPKTVDWKYIPKEIKAFFDQAFDKKIKYKDLWKLKYDMNILNMPTTYAWGGVHGAKKKYIEHSNKERIILNYDVESLYPSIKIEYDLMSRAAKDKDVYVRTKAERVVFKKAGQKADDLANKLVLNIAFGATLLASNALFDERNGRSVCVSGQLLMTDLLYRYIEVAKSIILINYNTDGIMFSIERTEVEKILAINKEWEKRTRLKLEETKINSIFQKDVNNYIMIESSGKVKKKGSYLKFGENAAGSWSINNDMIIVKEALSDYLTKGIPISETIMNCNDPFKFQMIAKAGHSYSSVFQIVNNKEIPIQNVNRVFASKDKKQGTLYKWHTQKAKDNKELETRLVNEKHEWKTDIHGVKYISYIVTSEKTGKKSRRKFVRYTGEKVGKLPDNCIIDNNMEISIDNIDKMWYINNCRSKIKDFIGVDRK